MTEKKSQSKLPVWIASGFLLMTIVAAYYYQANKAIKSPVPGVVNQEQKSSSKEIARPVLEPKDESAAEEVSVSEIVAESFDKENSESKESGSETDAILGEPLIKTVLVEADGAVVMGGTGLPNQKIDILLDDDIIETVVTDGRGDFATLFDLPYSANIRVLSLKSEVKGVNIFSPQEVIISPAQITEPPETTQTDDSDKSALVTKLEQSSDAKANGSEPQITDPVSAVMEKTDDLQQKANETKSSTSDMVIADSQVVLADNKKPNLNEIAEMSMDKDVVQETQAIAETVTSTEVENFKLNKETSKKVDLVSNKNTMGGTISSTEDAAKTAPIETAPVETAPVETASVETASVETAPVETAPVETAPVETAPVETASVETAPVETAPVETAPVETAPVETAPVESAPVETAPVETAPIETAPVETAPVETAPVETAPVESAPVETASVETAPVETAPVETAPVESAPVETAPVETASVETAPVETAPVETAPVETAPVETAPVETASVETMQDKITTAQKTENMKLDRAKKPLALIKSTDNYIEKKSDVQKAPIVMLNDNKGVRIIQSDTDKPENEVALDTISYDEGGEVNLAGRGKPASYVRIYLDNRPISTAAMDATGQWNTALSQIDPGIYTLRVDQLDPKGQVSSRLETPFKRESLETLQAQLLALDDPARINVVTVQPGNTLWAIARERYGLGILYVKVFQANRDKIRDEDLIYPGQIFELPD